MKSRSIRLFRALTETVIVHKKLFVLLACIGALISIGWMVTGKRRLVNTILENGGYVEIRWNGPNVPLWLEDLDYTAETYLGHDVYYVSVGNDPSDDDPLQILFGDFFPQSTLRFSEREWSVVLPCLRQLNGLREIHFGRTALGPSDVASVSDLKQVERVRFHPGTAVDDSTLAALAEIPRLTDLQLHGKNVTDQGMMHLSGCRLLQFVCLNDTQVTDVGVKQLHPQNPVISLWLRNAHVTDAGLAHALQFRSLYLLDLSGTRVTDDGIANPSIEKLAQLEKLDLSRTAIRGRGLIHLAQLPSLRELNLAGTAIDDSALAHIAHCPKLRFLDISRTTVTDKGLKQLHKSTSLRSVKVDDTSVSKEAYDDFREHVRKTMRAQWRDSS